MPDFPAGKHPDRNYHAKSPPGLTEVEVLFALAGMQDSDSDEKKAAHRRAAKDARFAGFHNGVRNARGRSFSRGDVTVTILEGPTKVGTHGLRFKVSATASGLPMDIDPWREIHNPPNKVPDGTWRTEVVPTGVLDENGEPEEGEVDVENFREDPNAAIESILLGSVIENPR